MANTLLNYITTSSIVPITEAYIQEIIVFEVLYKITYKTSKIIVMTNSHKRISSLKVLPSYLIIADKEAFTYLIEYRQN